MRQCWDCGAEKPKSEFYRGVQRCRVCCRAAWGTYTASGGKRAERAWRGQKKELLAAAKDRPCMDCGGSFPAVAMDFDHRDPSTKVAKVSELFKSGAVVMMREIAKCDLVCANCHRVRTSIRGDHRLPARKSTT